ncbi:MAG: hypothetical protein EPN38_09250 [Rhodanobacteraceae bacterium]|nr:MAG: hypothetical protein EPN38_09250 [Rhodanobacteraceae bacterium]
MKRLWVCLGLIVCGIASAYATTGVAFVHGTGDQTDAYDNYWQPAMVESVREGLADPANLLVVNCDFTQYMWTSGAAGCLATQLYSFIQARHITDLVVITHSDGGNVMRWLLSNPTYDSRYPAIIASIRWVDALAPSSAGTPLADAVMQGNVFESALGWLLGYQNDAVRQQQTSWMAYYNQNFLLGTAGRPALPKGFWDVVGSNVDANPFSSAAHCGGYADSVGLKITRAWLDDCSDGFINCSSAGAAGQVWFYDTQAAQGGNVLSHNQSRRACFGLDVILRNDLG